MTGFIEAIFLAAGLMSALVWVFVVMFAPRNGAFQTTSPLSRSVVARAWLYAPLWVPILLLFATMVPGLVAAAIGQGDHCEFRLAHHHHLCLLHPPHSSGHLFTWVVPLVLGLVALPALARGLSRTVKEWQLAKSLLAISVPSSLGPDVRILEDSTPLALTVGWRRPTILLSRGLLSSASATTLDIILLHERAHMHRDDVRWAILDHWFGQLYPESVAAPLLRQIGIAREQSCDRQVAVHLGNAHVVASALLEVARLRLVVPETGLSIVSGSLEQRVLHLVERPAKYPHWPVFVLFLFIATALSMASLIHTLVESTITLLIH